MTKTKVASTGNGTYVYHAEVPFLAAPKILKEKVINGVKWYKVKGRRPCRADLFDRVFKTNY